MPALAKQPTVAGAGAFARYFWLIYDSAVQPGGDIEALKRVSDPRCGTCANFIKGAEEVRSANQRIMGGRLQVISAECSGADEKTALVDLLYRRDELRVVDATGKQLQVVSAEPKVFVQLRLVRDRVEWRVRALRFPAVPS